MLMDLTVSSLQKIYDKRIYYKRLVTDKWKCQTQGADSVITIPIFIHIVIIGKHFNFIVKPGDKKIEWI